MLISVLNVGDGTCTVVQRSCLHHEDEFMVIECGSNGLLEDFSCARLLELVGHHPETFATIVVTDGRCRLSD